MILCGGRGLRLSDHARSIPKALVPVGGRPILWHVISLHSSPGQAHRVGDVVAEICRLTGGEVTPEVGGAGGAAFEIDRQWLDSTRLTELTGWRARIELQEGLRRTIEWYRGHPEALARLL